MSDPVVFRDLALVLAAAVGGGALAWWAHQPLILGYVFGGAPHQPADAGCVDLRPAPFDLFAEVGVVLLMFSVGIEFSVRDLLRVRTVALLGGPLGMIACAGLGLGTAFVLGWPPLQGVIVGLVTSVASTMVLTRLLLDRGELHSRHGRVMMGISLVEDLGVVVLIVLIPALGALEPGRLLAIGLALGKAVLILAPFAFLVAKGIPPLMSRVARTHNEELFLLVALAIALGTAALTQAVGLSLALGAFLAGLIISESDYAHETLARILPAPRTVRRAVLRDHRRPHRPAGPRHSLPRWSAIALVVVGKLVLRTASCASSASPGRTRCWSGSGSPRSASSHSSSCRWPGRPGTWATRSTTPPSPRRCSPSS